MVQKLVLVITSLDSKQVRSMLDGGANNQMFFGTLFYVDVGA